MWLFDGSEVKISDKTNRYRRIELSLRGFLSLIITFKSHPTFQISKLPPWCRRYDMLLRNHCQEVTDMSPRKLLVDPRTRRPIYKSGTSTKRFDNVYFIYLERRYLYTGITTEA